MINYQHHQVQNDLKELIDCNLPWDKLRNKTVLITGATGMLASYMGFTLIFLNKKLGLNIRPIFLARSKEKLNFVYGEELDFCETLVQDVCEPINYSGHVDFIFHAAGAASPYYIINDPVGVINANVIGTQNILNLAITSHTNKVLFASTREIYGDVVSKNIIDERDMGVLDPLNPRDCYPESKRLAESLLMAYHSQYGVDFNTVRIAHTYGPGMQIEGDGRVMSDLINDAVNLRDIHLKSTGQAERAFCYISDAILGIYNVMFQGQSAQAYNLANENEPTRIIDLAHLLQELVGSGKGVNVDIDKNSQAGYTNYKRSVLDTSRLSSLGWKPIIELKDGLNRTVRSFL